MTKQLKPRGKHEKALMLFLTGLHGAWHSINRHDRSAMRALASLERKGGHILVKRYGPHVNPQAASSWVE
jgi:hypothetical protein